MLFKFRADIELNNIHELSVKSLADRGIRLLLADLDNTLADYLTEEPDDKVREWVKSLSDCGITLAVVSNNKQERVEKFCSPLGINYYWKSGKPRRRTLRAAMEKAGADKNSTALIGDKYITDIMGAKRAGILSIKVKPIGKRRLFE